MSERHIHMTLVTLVAIFATLKLTGVIMWSWLWVLSPIWISIVAAVGFLCLVLITCGLKDDKTC